MLIPLADVYAARERLRPYLRPTPLVRSQRLSHATGAEVWFKLELLQPTHAFKVRGALNALLTLAPEVRARGVVAASAGNHGLGLCYAAAHVGVPATVVLPASAPEHRVDAIRRLGGRARVEGEDWNAAQRHALELAEAEGLRYVPPFDDPAIMAGQGTIALELLEQAPGLDAVICSVGGGGLISGIASTVRQLRPATRVFGVETEGADCMAQSLAAGRIVELPRFASIATSLGTKRTTERPFAIVQEAVERVEVVTDEAALRELLRCLDGDKLLCEPAASCTGAALLEGRFGDLAGRRVACVICGGNVTLAQVLGWAETFGIDLGGRPAPTAAR